MPKDCENVDLHPGDEGILRVRVTDITGGDSGFIAISPIDKDGDVIHPPVTLPSRAIKRTKPRDEGAEQQ